MLPSSLIINSAIKNVMREYELGASLTTLARLLKGGGSCGFCAGQELEVKAAGPPPNALFVFGDSYLDTGNLNKSKGFDRPWIAPYGKTYPGTPDGRFSDGRVFTDVFGM